MLTRIVLSLLATTLVVYNKKLKRSIVVDARGLSLYMFASDTPGSPPACIPQRDPVCADIWPALTTADRPIAGKGIRSALLSTSTWPDGTTLQVTYNGHPLYYFHGGHGFSAGDRKAGQIRGQGVAALW